MVFTKPKVVKKPLMTVWCLDESETVPETEKTAAGFLSSSRRVNFSQLELEDERENEVDGDLVVRSTASDGCVLYRIRWLDDGKEAVR